MALVLVLVPVFAWLQRGNIAVSVVEGFFPRSWAEAFEASPEGVEKHLLMLDHRPRQLDDQERYSDEDKQGQREEGAKKGYEHQRSGGPHEEPQEGDAQEEDRGPVGVQGLITNIEAPALPGLAPMAELPVCEVWWASEASVELLGWINFIQGLGIGVSLRVVVISTVYMLGENGL